MANTIKGIVSKKKRRFQEDGFDLDLSYITKNIVAMGFPAEKLEGVYRNHIDDVVKFLEHKHKNHYKVYNLCSERSYDKTKFRGPISDYPFDDHHPPKFEKIRDFCEDVVQWLSASTTNVAIVHCKAGKGRTGVMICACLLHTKHCKDASDALRFYSTQRTMDDKGVTIPSQRRYVFYYDNLLRSGLTYSPRQLLLHAIKLETLPLTCVGNYALFFVVLSHDLLLSQSEVYEKSKKGDCRGLTLSLKRPLPISGDVCIELFNKPKMMKKEKMLHFWFNTFFVDYSSSQVVEAHRTRELLQSQMMEELSQLGTNDSRSSWRFSSKYQEPRTVVGETPLSPPGVKVPSDEAFRFQSFKTLMLRKSELDKANKDKQDKLFTEDFAVKLFFTPTTARASATTPSSRSPAPSEAESNDNRNAASPLDSTDGSSSSGGDGEDLKSVATFNDEEYENSLSETDDDDDVDYVDDEEEDGVQSDGVDLGLNNTRL